MSVLPVCDFCKCEIDGVKRQRFAIGPLKGNGEWMTLCKHCHSLYGQFERTQLYDFRNYGPSAPWEAELIGRYVYGHFKITQKEWKDHD